MRPVYTTSVAKAKTGFTLSGFLPATQQQQQQQRDGEGNGEGKRDGDRNGGLDSKRDSEIDGEWDDERHRNCNCATLNVSNALNLWTLIGLI